MWKILHSIFEFREKQTDPQLTAEMTLVCGRKPSHCGKNLRLFCWKFSGRKSERRCRREATSCDKNWKYDAICRYDDMHVFWRVIVARNSFAGAWKRNLTRKPSLMLRIVMVWSTQYFMFWCSSLGADVPQQQSQQSSRMQQALKSELEKLVFKFKLNLCWKAYKRKLYVWTPWDKL